MAHQQLTTVLNIFLQQKLMGIAHAELYTSIMIGAGIALLFGGLARLIKRDKDTRDKK